MKKYYLTTGNNNIQVVTLDDSNKKKFQKKYNQLKEKYGYDFIELQYNNEIKEMINKSKKKITQKDIDYLLKEINLNLSTGDNPNNVKQTFLKNYKRDNNINPIFVVMLLSGSNIVDILKKLDFPKREIIVDVLTSGKSNEEMHKDLQKIDNIDRMEKQLNKKIKGVSVFASAVIVLAFIVSVLLKIYGLPMFKEFAMGLLESMNKGGEVDLLATKITNLLFITFSVIFFFFFALIITKRYFPISFYKALFRIPGFKTIEMYKNTIYILIFYSFYHTKITEYEAKLKDFFGKYGDIEVGFYNNPSELVSNIYDALGKHLGSKPFDSSVTTFMENLSKQANPDKNIKIRIDDYFEEIQGKIEQVQSSIFYGAIFLLGAIVLAVALSFYSIIGDITSAVRDARGS